jgi:hypothetical protein
MKPKQKRFEVTDRFVVRGQWHVGIDEGGYRITDIPVEPISTLQERAFQVVVQYHNDQNYKVRMQQEIAKVEQALNEGEWEDGD